MERATQRVAKESEQLWYRSQIAVAVLSRVRFHVKKRMGRPTILFLFLRAGYALASKTMSPGSTPRLWQSST